MKMTSEEIQASFDGLMRGASKSLSNHSSKGTSSFSQFERVSMLKETDIFYAINTNIKEA